MKCKQIFGEENPQGRKSSDIRVQSIFPNRDSNASSTAQIKQALKKK